MGTAARKDGETLLQDSALAGLKVLDLAGPSGIYCTKLLADLGADVVKVEPPGGDPTRGIGPFLHDEADPEKSLYFFHFNTNKRSVAVDLESAKGVDILKRLVRWADVLVETFQPGYLEGIGLGHNSMREMNPGLIITSITGFGQTGPWRDYKSSDLVALATGGLLYVCGWPDLPPQRMAGSQAYHMASAQAAVGTLLALHHKLNTGEGQLVDVSVQQSVPVCMQASLMVYDKTREPRKRAGNDTPFSSQGVFRCKDGHVDIGQLPGLVWWDRLVDWLDSEGVAGDLKEERWRDPFWRTRPEAINHVNEILKAFLARNGKSEIFHRGQGKGVVIGSINTPEDITNDACLSERGFFVSVFHPELGEIIRYVGAPYRLSATPWKIARRAPRVGEDSSEVFEELLVPAMKGTDQPRHDAHDGFQFPTVKGGVTSKGHLPLEGIRVVEFTEQVAGPMVGKALADYGAQVILVENEERVRKGASSRHPSAGAKSLTSLNQGNHFNKFNTNKLSVTLNIKHPRGMEIAKRLIGKSDIVISNFVPRVLDSWGLSYALLREIKQDIIFLTMPAFGTSGQYRDYRTLSWNLMAMSGLDYCSGLPGRDPIRASPWSHPDTASQPFHGLVATLAALYWRALTGKGQHIEVCQYESTLCFMETLIFDYLANNRIPEPQGNRLSYAAPHGVYRCKGEDQWCAIAVFSEDEWKALCRVIEREDLTYDDKFATLKSRMNNADELDAVVTRWTERRTSWDVMELMQKAGVAAGVVESEEDLLVRDPQFKARNHWLRINHPDAGELLNEDWGFRLDSVPPLKWRHAPLLGEHNDLVLNGILGIPETEINQLIIEGVVG